MKRRYDLILRSLGSEYMSEPDSKDLAKWISGQRGSRCDLFSYNIEKSLLAQKKADIVGDDIPVSLTHRLQQPEIKAIIELEKETVDRFQRV